MKKNELMAKINDIVNNLERIENDPFSARSISELHKTIELTKNLKNFIEEK